jgi:alkanesulfonate monooxygenase SsuD/methylene tetrahydromethanopterin reductase-like flavin-dependent oxidoreductase (luciferase family)
MWKSVQALVFVTEDADFADSVREGDMSTRSIVGSIDQLVEEFGRYADLGFDEFIVPDFTLGKTAGERADRLSELRAAVSA